MAFNDLLSTSFLFSIAIIIILIGGIFAYVSYRMSEQDHKISSMLGLISTMAGELQFFRSKLSNKQEEEEEEVKEKIILDPNNLIAGSIKHPVLISVSDDESEESEDQDQDDETDDDQDDETDDDQDDETYDDETDVEKNEEVDLEDMIEFDQPILNLEDFIEDNNIKSIHLEEPIDLNFTNKEDEHEHEQMDELLTSDLKTISITDLEEPNKKQDYKKMPINKLREVVVEKGIIAEASKLKKQDILKLLGDE